MDSWLWLLRDANVFDRDSCTESACEDLLRITYKMHHRLVSRHESKHRVAGSREFTHDADPWTVAPYMTRR